VVLLMYAHPMPGMELPTFSTRQPEQSKRTTCHANARTIVEFLVLPRHAASIHRTRDLRKMNSREVAKK